MNPPRRLFVLVATGLLVGCSARVRPVVPPPAPSLPVQEAKLRDLRLPAVTLSVDPINAVISRAEAEVVAGEAELAQGRRLAARQRFDVAIDTLLNVPGGARADARLRAEFERLLDRISAHESLDLRTGDGFAEARTEPAAIDDLLAVSNTDRPLVPARTTAEIVAADLAMTPHDIPITVNDKVLSYVELFQTDLRAFVEDGLARGSRYLPMIQEVFQAKGLPLDLAYVPLIESAFKPTALSRVKAKGMWQFMTPTAKDVGLHENWFLDERSDPEKATRGAALYLSQGRVQRAMKAAKNTDYWEITKTSRYLPRETREYVPMMYAAMLIAANPMMYGFEIEPVEPLAYDAVTVPDALRLNTVAEWLNIPVEEIQSLNPELRRGMTPIGKHLLKVPVGMGATVESRLASASPGVFASATFRFHTVKKGETLAAIARRYKTTAGKLAAANDLKATSRVRGGTTLMVPASPAPALASASRPAAPKATATRPTAVASAAPSGTTTYRVKAGDNLSRIARQFGMSVERLKSMNRLASDSLSVGDRLTVRR
jgi:membrane-bound lytic murein transglycosylase D